MFNKKNRIMGNCLKTQLKESVNNSLLPYIGEMVFSVVEDDPSADNILYLGASSVQSIRVSEGGGFALSKAELDSNPKTEYDLPATSTYTTLYFKHGNYKIFVSGKYASLNVLGNTTNIAIDTSELKYLTQVGTLSLGGNNAAGTLDDFAGYTSAKEVSITNSQIKGSLASLPKNTQTINLRQTTHPFDLAGLAGMTNLSTLYINGSNVAGNISILSQITTLTRCPMYVCPNIYGDISSLGTLINCHNFEGYNSANLSGELNDLISSLRTNGASGEYSFNFYSTGVTYNGGPMTDIVTVTI